MTDYTVADLVAEFLERMGVKTAFGVISVHNIPIMDAISRRNRVRIVSARGEAGAAHMADGYTRADSDLGVLISSTGPGAANACGGCDPLDATPGATCGTCDSGTIACGDDSESTFCDGDLGDDVPEHR